MTLETVPSITSVASGAFKIMGPTAASNTTALSGHSLACLPAVAIVPERVD
jgi:hypothetical protein